MVEVISIEMSEDKRTMLETISAYEKRLDQAQLEIDVLELGLEMLRKVVKEGLE